MTKKLVLITSLITAFTGLSFYLLCRDKAEEIVEETTESNDRPINII